MSRSADLGHGAFLLAAVYGHVFERKTSVIEYTRDALESYAQDIIALAQSEHLDAHANSIAVRFAEENNDENR